MPNYIFETTLEVRDYECDIEGIVNNANYLHYIEHTRHLFLRSIGVSFAELHNKGVDPVVRGMTIRYKTPLRCDDLFVSKLALRKEGIRYVFTQDLYRESDMRHAFSAEVELVCIVNGKVANSDAYDKAFEKFIEKK